jgi:pentatricopeptide repeat protein
MMIVNKTQEPDFVISNPGISRIGRKEFQNRTQPSNHQISKDQAWEKVDRLGSSQYIDAWMEKLAVASKTTSLSSFETWSVRHQIDFIRLLQSRGAYASIMIFVKHFSFDVYVYTTAISAMALSQQHRKKALVLLDEMDKRKILPTAYTFTALICSVDGPDDTRNIMKKLNTYQKVRLTVEIYDSAIHACRRTPKGALPSNKDWQTALNLFQQMRRNRITPTTKTYVALLQVLARTGQVKMAVTLLEEIQNTPGLHADDRVWGAAMNVCAQAGDYQEAIRLIMEMQQLDCRPNTRHCSSLLKAFARAGQDKLALRALDMMLAPPGSSNLPFDGGGQLFTLPPTPPDLVALNTVLAACSKVGNFNDTMALFKRIKAGEFREDNTGQPISLDQISFHSVLSSCRSPKIARELVKEVR